MWKLFGASVSREIEDRGLMAKICGACVTFRDCGSIPIFRLRLAAMIHHLWYAVLLVFKVISPAIIFVTVWRWSWWLRPWFVYFHWWNFFGLCLRDHSSTVSFVCVLINNATGCVNPKDARARLMNTSINDVDWVLRSMLRSNMLLSAPFSVRSVIIVSNVEGVFHITFYFSSIRYESVLEGVFESFLRCLEWTSRELSTYILHDSTSNTLSNTQLGFNPHVFRSRCRLGAWC